MSLASVITAAQTRVTNDQTALTNGGVAGADLPAAQAILNALNDVQALETAQEAGATARVTAATTAGADVTTNKIPALNTSMASVTPKGLTLARDMTLTTAVATTTYTADLGHVQSTLKTLIADTLTAADAQVDLDASRKKVTNRTNALTQWVAIAEGAYGKVGSLLAASSAAIAINDLAHAWWAVAQAKACLAVISDPTLATALTTAKQAVTDQCEDYAVKVSAKVTADSAVAADLSLLGGYKTALATSTAAADAAVVTAVHAF